MTQTASDPASWQAFVETCLLCRDCALSENRRHVVVYRGAERAPLMLIGEGPGADEDRQGLPFVGRSGQLLNVLLTAFGLSEADYHIANVVKCRPPGNREPTDGEIAACRRLLDRQIELVQPKVIVLLGSVAYRRLTGTPVSISKVRGHFFEWQGCQVMPTFHPAYVLRDGRQRTKLWVDMGMARRKLEELALLPPLTFI